MTNKRLHAIIDYLESGEKFADTLVGELNRTDLSCFEKRTYSSLLDALNGATELYCAMTEWPDNIVYISRQVNSQKEEPGEQHSTEYLQGFMDCMKAVQKGGFKGMEDKINSMLHARKVQL